MRKYTSFFAPLLSILLPLSVLAVTFPPSSAVPTTSVSDINDFYDILCAVTQWVMVFGIIIGALFIVYGGVKYVTSGGDSSSQNDAKKTILMAVIGVVFLILAVAIVNIVARFFGSPVDILDFSAGSCT